MKRLQSLLQWLCGVVRRVRPTDANITHVRVILLKPSYYDDDGFVHRYWRGVISSASLQVLYARTVESLQAILPAGMTFSVHMLEDGITSHAWKLRFLHLYHRFVRKHTKLITGFVGVQTAQFPRACDLARRWQTVDATCVIGGFHVSGMVATHVDGIKDSARPDVPCPHMLPAEIQQIMDEGVIVFAGEAEEVWREALADIIFGHPKQMYRGGQPMLADVPVPEYPPSYQKFFVTEALTINTSLGCPAICSFCAPINVQGRKPRNRDPLSVVRQIESLCATKGKVIVFFTDDNFGRNPSWEIILDGLARLRAAGNNVSIMVQADLACHKIPRFLEKLEAAGCGSIFMGVESMNPLNLATAGKRQNKVSEYQELWQQCRDRNMFVHAGYIIGFPHDTPESVAQDIEDLAAGVEQASFYLLMPLPGSEDEVRATVAGVPIDRDYNLYDGMHVVSDPALMTREQLLATYHKAWRQFYRPSNMIRALRRCKSRTVQLDLLRKLIWYRWAYRTEKAPPMVAGLYRSRSYWDRRPGARRLGYLTYLGQEVWRYVRDFGLAIGEFYVFQHVVFDGLYGNGISQKRDTVSDWIHGVGDWFRLTFGKKVTRRWLHAFWRTYARNRWHLLWDPWAYRWHLLMLPFVASEVVYTIRFASLFPLLLLSRRRRQSVLSMKTM